MNKILFFVSAFLLPGMYSSGQRLQENIVYIVDSILVKQDPEEGNGIKAKDIAMINIIKNKDSLQLLGYDKFEGAVFIFTKEYQNRPEDIKQIPSLKQMEIKGSERYFRGNLYNGQFIDYYYSGRKEGEGTFVNGKAEGRRIMYYQNGNVRIEKYYLNGVENGLEKEYFEDGSLKQQNGLLINDEEDGVWEMYFPNGRLKQRNRYNDETMEVETTRYYSTGKIESIEVTKNGKTTQEKEFAKVSRTMNKGHENNKKGDFKMAIKNYSKAIDLDAGNAKAYFARGTVNLNEFQFDDAILDFDKALDFEPYFEEALSNRAFARIRKYEYGNNRKLLENKEITVMASIGNSEIPKNELTIICSDLKQAIFLGDRSKMTLEAFQGFCETKIIL